MLQTIFLWTLIARQISQALDTGLATSHKDKLALVIKPPPELDSTIEPLGVPPSSSEPESMIALQGVLPNSRHQSVALSEEQKKMIKDVFDLFDTSTEGLDENDSDHEDEGRCKTVQSGLDESEFASAIKALGFSSRNHKKMAKTLMMKVDTDGNKSVSLEEFSSLMEGQLTGRDPEEEINAIFAAFVNYVKNGRISKLRLAEVAEYVGVNLSTEELDSMFFNDVTKGEEGINQHEFVQILKHSTWI